jgi:hypothetical protein
MKTEDKFNEVIDQIDDLDMFKGVNNMTLKDFAKWFYYLGVETQRQKNVDVLERISSTSHTSQSQP